MRPEGTLDLKTRPIPGFPPKTESETGCNISVQISFSAEGLVHRETDPMCSPKSLDLCTAFWSSIFVASAKARRFVHKPTVVRFAQSYWIVSL